MGKKKKVSRAQSKSVRKIKREELGRLQDIVVTKRTLTRYDDAVIRFLIYLEVFGLMFASHFIQLDEDASGFIEHLWQEGESIRWAMDLLSGLQHHMPFMKRRFNSSWRLCLAWTRAELPARAMPLPFPALMGIVSLAILNDLPDVAVLFLVGFLGMLRTSEMFGVRLQDIEVKGNTVTIKLQDTKASVRKRGLAVVSFTSQLCASLLRELKRTRPKGSFLARNKPQKMRVLLNEFIRFLQIETIFSWYSFRRGVATFGFERHGSMEKTLLRGRWSSVKTARVYVNDSLASFVALQLPETIYTVAKELYHFACNK